MERSVPMSSETMEILSEAEAQELIHLGPPFRLTHGGYGVELAGGTPSVEAYGKALISLKVVAERFRYLRGDLINMAEKEHGEAASQIIDPEYIGDEKEANEDRY